MDSIIKDLSDRAGTIDREMSTKLDQVNRNEGLTPKGKRDQVEAIEASRRQQVATLQEEASRRLRAEAERLRREIKSSRAAEIERLRKSVGDQPLIEAYRVELLHTANTTEIRGRIDNACNDWERDILTLLAGEVLTVRSFGSNEDDALAARAALDDFRRARESTTLAKTEARLREIELWGPTWSDALDLAQQRKTGADWVGEKYSTL